PHSEVDVSEQPALRRRQEEWAAVELACPPGVVEQRCREEQVRPEPLMELARFAAERRDGDRVLEQAAAPAVVPVDRRGKRPEAPPTAGVLPERGDETPEARVSALCREEVEKTVELVEIAPRGRDELARIVVDRLERPDLELEPVAKALDTAQDPDCLAFPEAAVQQ